MGNADRIANHFFGGEGCLRVFRLGTSKLSIRLFDEAQTLFDIKNQSRKSSHPAQNSTAARPNKIIRKIKTHLSKCLSSKLLAQFQRSHLRILILSRTNFGARGIKMSERMASANRAIYMTFPSKRNPWSNLVTIDPAW